MSEYIQEIVTAINNLHEQLKKAETYCMEFAIEFLKQRSGNFKKVDSYYDVDGLVTTYKCARDDRIYTVKVTPSKP